ncbi:hypothetical protein PR002_g1705 [Phytophthora rubi]|uniref:Uncharacterized protein n=1 Tax=Phytophthora rubi TaxID=129364 RepID=A0A6A3P153_9STRA|nr:hypothetical protein PR002_g1705 [Phytophthora rubi]
MVGLSRAARPIVSLASSVALTDIYSKYYTSAVDSFACNRKQEMPTACRCLEQRSRGLPTRS